MEILNQISAQVNHVETLKNKVLVAKKVQLHSGMQGFESPEAYGVYKDSGGHPLGVVGSQFEPMDLKMFLDCIEQSVLSSNMNLDLSKLTYHEYYHGAKVEFKLPFQRFEIQSPMVGDVLETSLSFRTGFDGRTKMSLGFYSLRLWCTNGAKNWKKDVDLSLKNTVKNQAKIMYFTNEIVKASEQINDHVKLLNESVKKRIVQSDIDKFLSELTGYDVKEYSELTARKRNILDAINQSVAIEMQNTGVNLFSLLQGVTRYTTHNLGKGNPEALLFERGSELNQTAHSLVANLLLN
jgi:hypothetical protein